MKSSQKQTQEQKIQDLRKLNANKKCFECGVQGTNYVVPNIGVFVCQGCAGLHRDFNRVKGISVCSFTEQEVNMLERVGNENARKVWLATYTESDYPLSDTKDLKRMKNYIRLKYQEKMWYKPDQTAEESQEIQTVSNGQTNGKAESQVKEEHPQRSKEDLLDLFAQKIPQPQPQKNKQRLRQLQPNNETSEQKKESQVLQEQNQLNLMEDLFAPNIQQNFQPLDVPENDIFKSFESQGDQFKKQQDERDQAKQHILSQFQQKETLPSFQGMFNEPIQISNIYSEQYQAQTSSPFTQQSGFQMDQSIQNKSDQHQYVQNRESDFKEFLPFSKDTKQNEQIQKTMNGNILSQQSGVVSNIQNMPQQKVSNNPFDMF